MKKILFSIVLIINSTCVFAYDCFVNGIYYNLDKSLRTAEVTSGNCLNGFTNTCYDGSVTIPSSISVDGIDYIVTSIGSSSFTLSNISSVTIPNTVTEIKGGAFSNCSWLTKISIPNSVTSIGGSAFYFCNKLSSISFPNNITFIGASAFANCSSLTKITFTGENVPVFGNGWLYVPAKTPKIYVPHCAFASYQAALNVFNVLETEGSGADLNVTVNNDQRGKVTGTGSYCFPTGQISANILINATANYGYRFQQWSDGNTQNPA